MSQARRTQHFAKRAKQVRRARRGEVRGGDSSLALHLFRSSRKMQRSLRLAHKVPVMQAILCIKFMLENLTRWE